MLLKALIHQIYFCHFIIKIQMQVFKIIRENGKKYFDRIRNERLKQNLLQAIPFWIASLIAGLIAVLYTKLFSLSEYLSLSIFHKATWAIFISAPICFVSAWIIIVKFCPYAKGSGIPQVMAAIEFANPKQNYKADKLLKHPHNYIQNCIKLYHGNGWRYYW